LIDGSYRVVCVDKGVMKYIRITIIIRIFPDPCKIVDVIGRIHPDKRQEYDNKNRNFENFEKLTKVIKKIYISIR